jgi:hypothetical protein
VFSGDDICICQGLLYELMVYYSFVITGASRPVASRPVGPRKRLIYLVGATGSPWRYVKLQCLKCDEIAGFVVVPFGMLPTPVSTNLADTPVS